MNCKVGGCPNPVQKELHDHGLCLEHFLDQVQERTRSFARQLDLEPPVELLRQTALQFIVLTAAKIATIGTQSPPEEQLLRGRMLNAMLLLADLRERLDRTPGKKAAT